MAETNRIRIVNWNTYSGELYFKWPSIETLGTYEVSRVLFFKQSGVYRLIFKPIPIIHPANQPRIKNCEIKGKIQLDLESIIGDSIIIVVPIVENMWNCQVWSECFICGWTVNITCVDNHITMIELRKH